MHALLCMCVYTNCHTYTRTHTNIYKNELSTLTKIMCYHHVYLDRSWAAPFEMYDLRMYRHTLGQPLTDADILSIAFEAIPTAAQPQFTNAQCLQITDPKMEDQAWKDVFGNSCDWCKFLSLHFCSLCFHIFHRNCCAGMPSYSPTNLQCLLPSGHTRHSSW